MIIDSHVHLVDTGWVHESFLLNMARVAVAGSTKEGGQGPAPEIIVEVLKSNLFDPTGEKLIEEMDEADVERSCIFAVDYGLLTGDPGVPILEQNKAIANAVSNFPDRFTGFFTIDPRRDNSLENFCRAIEDWGLQGLKLHPTAGFFPYDEIIYPLYQKCIEYNVPVLIHTGSQPAPMKSRFARPVYIDDVASDFPNLNIIMAHAGHHWWEEALLVCSVKPNCFMDISGWQRDFIEHPLNFYQVLRKIVDAVGPWRVFFASDGPYLNTLLPLKQWVEGILSPQLPEGTDITFTPEELEIIMGKSFARLLRIEN